jgi:hypothetical protein
MQHGAGTLATSAYSSAFGPVHLRALDLRNRVGVSADAPTFHSRLARHSDMRIRDTVAKMRPDGCGGGSGRVELLTSFSRPVRKITVLNV